MTDESEITGLIHSYARLLDAGDADAVAALFEHSTWRTWPDGSLRRGAEEVRPTYRQLVASAGDRPTRHLLTNLTVEVAADGRTASAHCYWTVLQGAPERPIEITLAGRYTDAFEKVDDQWRFTDRLITVDMAGAASPPSS